VAAALLAGAVFAGQGPAFGAAMMAPVQLAAAELPMLTAAAVSPATEVTAQETRGTGATSSPQTGGQEAKSISRQPSSKQRRRRPKMASVPPGSPAAVQETAAPAAQALAPQPAKAAAAATKPAAGESPKAAEAGGDPFASSRPQAVVKETEESDPFAAPGEAQPGAAAKAEPPAKPAAEAKPPKTGKRYAMAPIRWVARVSETLGLLRERRTESSTYGLATTSTLTQKRTFSNTQTAQIMASSYIMQPYIALVSGGIGVVSSKENTHTTATASGAPGSSTHTGKRDNKLIGNGALALFARSRFPFSANFSVTDSRAGQELGGEDTTIKSLNLQQNYRPVFGPSRYALGYQNTATEAKRSGSYSYSALNGTYTTRVGSNQDQPVMASLRHTVSKQKQGENLTTDIAAAEHTYLPPDSLLSLKSYANYTRSMQADQEGQSGARARFMQLSTVMGWQPEAEDVPLFLSGTARYFRAVTSAQGTQATTTNIVGTLAALYDASSNLKYNADASVTRSIGRGTGDLITTQSATAIYQSDVVKLADNKASYRWSANGGATNQTGGQSTGGGSGFNPRAFAGAGHSLSGPIDYSLLGKLRPRYTLGQDVSTNMPLSENAGRIFERVTVLRNTAGVSGIVGNERLSGTVSASVFDSRVYGGVNAGRTRTVAVSVGGQGQQPIYEGYGAKVDGSVQSTRSPDGKMQTSGALLGTYVKNSVFGVRGLRYRAQFDITAKSTASANAAVSDPNRKPLAYALDQYLSYRIGMNEARLTAFLDRKDGVRRASLYLQLRAWRTIGN
jgi:hypothetical protein